MKLSHMNRLSALLADEYGFPADAIIPSTLLDAIGLTSLDRYRLAAMVIDAFGVDLPFGVESDWDTFDDVLACLIDAARSSAPASRPQLTAEAA